MRNGLPWLIPALWLVAMSQACVETVSADDTPRPPDADVGGQYEMVVPPVSPDVQDARDHIGGGGSAFLNPYPGPTSLEHIIVGSEAIARVSYLGSATSTNGGWALLELRFEVHEYLKGSGPNEIGAVAASWWEEEHAQWAAPFLAAAHDSRWDSREAIVFLIFFDVENGAPELRGTFGPDQYFFTYVGGIHEGYVDRYTVASTWFKLWLPAASQATTTAQLFMLDVPTEGSTPAGGPGGVISPSNTEAVPTISLGDLKSHVATLEAHANLGGTPEYRTCVEAYYRISDTFKYRDSIRERVDHEFYSIGSGLPAETIISAFHYSRALSPDNYGRHWFEGLDHDLVRSRAVDFVASPSAFDYGDYIYTRQVVTARPLPAGTYTFFANGLGVLLVPCSGNVDWSFFQNRNHYNLTVTAPQGVLHEAFFDPVAIDDAVGADGPSGVLKPADFSLGGVTTTILSLKWENGTVTMGLSPAASLSGNMMDVIDVTGTTTLSLSLGSARTTALAWSVPDKPWSDGDLLMLRIGPTATSTATGVTVTDVVEPASAPQNLGATSTASAVRLEWDAPDRGPVTGYQVLRRQPSLHAVGVFLTIVEDTGSTSTSYVDTEVESRTQYVYRVAAVNPAGVSGRSRFVSIVTGDPIAPAPGDVSVSLSAGVFTVTWSPVTGAARYDVQYRTGMEDDWSSVATTTAVTASLEPDGGPACGTTYEFRVLSRGDGTTYGTDWSEPSGPASVTTERCNEAPEFGESSYSFVVLEGAATGTVVGTVAATDEDDDTLAYSIASGNEDGRFAIATSTGAITLTATLDLVSGATSSLTVEVSDGYGGTASAPVTVSVGDATCTGGIAVPSPGANAGLVGDCETLLGLVAALSGTGTLNWSGETPITSWDGVTVEGDPGRVTQLSLRGRSLTGIVPSALADLSGLRVLNLSGNSLTGGIPAELGNLSELTALWLYQNELTGEIPTELGGLLSLIWMSLAENDLTGPIPSELGDLPDLSQMLLQRNRLSGEIPAELGGLGNMIVFQLHDNDLSGPIPWELGNLSGLSIIQLSENSLEGCVPPALRAVSSNDFGSLGLPYCAQAGPVPVPGSVGASVSGGTFTVMWTAVTGAGRYEVQYRTGGDWSSAGTTTAAMLTYSPEGGPACATEYEFRVRAYGDGVTYVPDWGAESEPESVTTGECSRAPEFASSTYAFSVAEDASVGDPVGTVSATDPDDGDTVSYGIIGGNEDGKFAMATSTGDITVAGALDHETDSSYTLTVEASDGRGGSATTTVDIAVTDVAEDSAPAPGGVGVSFAADTFTVTWSAVTGASHYEVQYRTGGADAAWSSVGTTTAAMLTYSPEGGPACGTTYEFRVRSHGDGETYASDWGPASDPESETTDACNQVPEFASSTYAFSVAETAATGTSVGTVSATDPDDGELEV